jgi:hypothetical protein
MKPPKKKAAKKRTVRTRIKRTSLLSGEAEEWLDTVEVPEIHGRVHVACTVTKNVGDMEFVKVGVAFEAPVALDEASYDRAMRVLSEKLDKEIGPEIERAMVR